MVPKIKFIAVLLLGAAMAFNLLNFLGAYGAIQTDGLTAQVSGGPGNPVYNYWYIYLLIVLVLLAVYFILSDYELKGFPGFLIGLVMVVLLPFIYFFNKFFGSKITLPKAGPAVPPAPEMLAAAPVVVVPPAGPENVLAPSALSPSKNILAMIAANKKVLLFAGIAILVAALGIGGFLVFNRLVVPPAVITPSPIAFVTPAATPSVSAIPFLNSTPATTSTAPATTAVAAPTGTTTPYLTATSLPSSVTPVPSPSPVKTVTPLPFKTPTPSPSKTPTPTPVKTTITPGPSITFTPTPTSSETAAAATSTPTATSTAAITPTGPTPAFGTTYPTPNLSPFLQPGEKPYTAPPPTLLEKMIPPQYRSIAFIVVILVLLPLIYLSPFFYLASSVFKRLFFLTEKLRTTTRKSPPAPILIKMVTTPKGIISSVVLLAVLGLLIFVPPFSTQSKFILDGVKAVFTGRPAATPIVTPFFFRATPTASVTLTATPAVSPIPVVTLTASPTGTSAIISPTLLPAVPTPSLTSSPAVTVPVVTPTQTVVAIISSTPLPTPAVASSTPLVSVTIQATPTSSEGTSTPVSSSAVSVTPSPPVPVTSVFSPLKDIYNKALSPDYRWLLYLLAALLFAILILVPFLPLLARLPGRIGGGLMRVVAGKIGISRVNLAVISENWAAIEWQTKSPSDSIVEFSTVPSSSPNYQPQVAIDDDVVRDHRITIAGLQDSTNYFLRVSSTDKFGNKEQSAEITFKTTESEVQKKKQSPVV